MNEIICKGRGFNCNLDCKQKDTCDQYVDNKIDIDKLTIKSFDYQARSISVQDYNPFIKTAITRNKLSNPMKILKQKGLLQGSILDYGCGHGEDVRMLQFECYNIEGYDKFNPLYMDTSLLEQYYDTITCNYVFNVIPDIAEHDALLKDIEKLGKTIYICVRADIKAIKDNWKYITEYDCWETGKGSYQRFYNTDEMINTYFGDVEYISNNSSFKLFKLK